MENIRILMEKPKKETTQQRHADVFSYYEELVSGYGEMTKGLSQGFLCQQVADKFHYSTDMVRAIIRNNLKSSK